MKITVKVSSQKENAFKVSFNRFNWRKINCMLAVLKMEAEVH